LNRLKFLLKLAQSQDIRYLPNVNNYLFRENDWIYLNKIYLKINNVLDDIIYNNQKLNFKFLALNPSLMALSGSKKYLSEFVKLIYKYLTNVNDKKQYSSEQILKLINDLSIKLNTYSFSEPTINRLKTEIITLLSTWKTSVQNIK